MTIDQRARLGEMVQQTVSKHFPEAPEGAGESESLVDRLFRRHAGDRPRNRSQRAQELTFTRVTYRVGPATRHLLYLGEAGLGQAEQALRRDYTGEPPPQIIRAELLTESALKASLQNGRSIEALLPADDRAEYLALVEQRTSGQKRGDGNRIRETVYGTD